MKFPNEFFDNNRIYSFTLTIPSLEKYCITPTEQLSKPCLVFRCGFLVDSTIEYLKGLLGKDILEYNDRYIAERVTLRVNGKKNVITAINKILSMDSFIDKTNEEHRGFINDLISQIERDCGYSLGIPKLEDPGRQEQKAPAALTFFRQPSGREVRHHQGCVERCLSYVNYMFGRG